MKKYILLTLLFSLNVLAAPNSIIAIVNDDVITFNSISNDIKEETTKEQKLALVNRQIDLNLQLQKIKELGIKPNKSSINTALNNVAVQNNITFAKLKSLAEFDQITKNINNQLSLRGLKQFVLKDNKIELSKNEINTALLKNPGNGKLDDQIRIAQIAISSIDRTDSMIQSEDELIQNFLLDLVNKINNGESFSALAKLYSQDPSYKDGGESAWLNEDKLPEVFKHNLSKSKPGELSAPFKAGQGWRIIKIIDKRKVDNNLALIKHTLMRNKQNAYFNNWVKKLRDKAYIEIFEHKL